MEDLNKIHKEKFYLYPVIIGLYFYEPEKLINNIKESIKNNNPYNEYDLLSSEEKKAYDNGDLLF